MFTSRAEYRILLRQDNADERLSRKGEKIGTVSKERIQRLEEKEEMIKEIIDFLKKENIAPDEINKLLEENDTAKIHSKVKAYNIVLRPQISLSNFLSKYEKAKKLKVFKSERFNEIVESAEIDIKYNGYIEREKLVADKIKRLEELKLPQDIDYNKLLSISTEGRQKLDRIKPSTIGQASRISGVSPSDIHVLLMYMGR